MPIPIPTLAPVDIPFLATGGVCDGVAGYVCFASGIFAYLLINAYKN